MARPTKYTEELLEKARAYIVGGWKECEDQEFPSVLGLCVHLGIGRSTAYQWAADESKEFSDILEACNEISELVLLNGGISGKYNSQITKLVLGKHGYHDKQDTELTGKDGGPISASIEVSFVEPD